MALGISQLVSWGGEGDLWKFRFLGLIPMSHTVRPKTNKCSEILAVIIYYHLWESVIYKAKWGRVKKRTGKRTK